MSQGTMVAGGGPRAPPRSCEVPPRDVGGARATTRGGRGDGGAGGGGAGGARAAVAVTTHAMTRTTVGGGSYRSTIARMVGAAAILRSRARDGEEREDDRPHDKDGERTDNNLQTSPH